MGKRVLGLLCLLITILLITGLVQAQQPGKVPRIGYLITSSASVAAPRMDLFRQGLCSLGYNELRREHRRLR
jgi:hypothetical protein